MRKIGGGTIEGKSTRRTKVAGKVGRSRGGGGGGIKRKNAVVRRKLNFYVECARSTFLLYRLFVRLKERERAGPFKPCHVIDKEISARVHWDYVVLPVPVNCPRCSLINFQGSLSLLETVSRSPLTSSITRLCNFFDRAVARIVMILSVSCSPPLRRAYPSLLSSFRREMKIFKKKKKTNERKDFSLNFPS